MKFVFACDLFKGTISSSRCAELLKASALRAFPDAECVCLPVADGGEGTVRAVVAASGGKLVRAQVQDPLGRPVMAEFGLLPAPDDAHGSCHAVIEMAAASGLPLLAPTERNPLKTSTFGTGQLILAALDAGATDISLAIGGSATNDCGMGCMRALGARFLDAAGNELVGRGEDLAAVAAIDLARLDPRIAGVAFHVMCDVDNPLVGLRGATHVFAPQKGALPQDVLALEAGMLSFANLLEHTFGRAFASASGMGAAGGLGAAASAFLGARMVPGVEWVLDAIGFDRHVATADLCITGEGHADAQSAHGKVISGVARRCAHAAVPCIAVVGGMDDGALDLLDLGVSALVPTVTDASPLEDVLARGEKNFALAADRVFSLFKIGLDAR